MNGNFLKELQSTGKSKAATRKPPKEDPLDRKETQTRVPGDEESVPAVYRQMWQDVDGDIEKFCMAFLDHHRQEFVKGGGNLAKYFVPISVEAVKRRAPPRCGIFWQSFMDNDYDPQAAVSTPAPAAVGPQTDDATTEIPLPRRYFIFNGELNSQLAAIDDPKKKKRKKADQMAKFWTSEWTAAEKKLDQLLAEGMSQAPAWVPPHPAPGDMAGLAPPHGIFTCGVGKCGARCKASGCESCSSMQPATPCKVCQIWRGKAVYAHFLQEARLLPRDDEKKPQWEAAEKAGFKNATDFLAKAVMFEIRADILRTREVALLEASAKRRIKLPRHIVDEMHNRRRVGTKEEEYRYLRSWQYWDEVNKTRCCVRSPDDPWKEYTIDECRKYYFEHQSTNSGDGEYRFLSEEDAKTFLAKTDDHRPFTFDELSKLVVEFKKAAPAEQDPESPEEPPKAPEEEARAVWERGTRVTAPADCERIWKASPFQKEFQEYLDENPGDGWQEYWASEIKGTGTARFPGETIAQKKVEMLTVVDWKAADRGAEALSTELLQLCEEENCYLKALRLESNTAMLQCFQLGGAEEGSEPKLIEFHGKKNITVAPGFLYVKMTKDEEELFKSQHQRIAQEIRDFGTLRREKHEAVLAAQEAIIAAGPNIFKEQDKVLVQEGGSTQRNFVIDKAEKNTKIFRTDVNPETITTVKEIPFDDLEPDGDTPDERNEQRQAILHRFMDDRSQEERDVKMKLGEHLALCEWRVVRREMSTKEGMQSLRDEISDEEWHKIWLNIKADDEDEEVVEEADPTRLALHIDGVERIFWCCGRLFGEDGNSRCWQTDARDGAVQCAVCIEVQKVLERDSLVALRALTLRTNLSPPIFDRDTIEEFCSTLEKDGDVLPLLRERYPLGKRKRQKKKKRRTGPLDKPATVKMKYERRWVSPVHPEGLTLFDFWKRIGEEKRYCISSPDWLAHWSSDDELRMQASNRDWNLAQGEFSNFLDAYTLGETPGGKVVACTESECGQFYKENHQKFRFLKCCGSDLPLTVKMVEKWCRIKVEERSNAYENDQPEGELMLYDGNWDRSQEIRITRDRLKLASDSEAIELAYFPSSSESNWGGGFYIQGLVERTCEPMSFTANQNVSVCIVMSEKTADCAPEGFHRVARPTVNYVFNAPDGSVVDEQWTIYREDFLVDDTISFRFRKPCQAGVFIVPWDGSWFGYPKDSEESIHDLALAKWQSGTPVDPDKDVERVWRLSTVAPRDLRKHVQGEEEQKISKVLKDNQEFHELSKEYKNIADAFNFHPEIRLSEGQEVVVRAYEKLNEDRVQYEAQDTHGRRGVVQRAAKWSKERFQFCYRHERTHEEVVAQVHNGFFFLPLTDRAEKEYEARKKEYLTAIEERSEQWAKLEKELERLEALEEERLRILEEMMKVECPNCNERFTKKQFGQHEAKCPFGVESCRWCPDAILRRDLNNHQKFECHFRPVRCLSCKCVTKAGRMPFGCDDHKANVVDPYMYQNWELQEMEFSEERQEEGVWSMDWEEDDQDKLQDNFIDAIASCSVKCIQDNILDYISKCTAAGDLRQITKVFEVMFVAKKSLQHYLIGLMVEEDEDEDVMEKMQLCIETLVGLLPSKTKCLEAAAAAAETKKKQEDLDQKQESALWDVKRKEVVAVAASKAALKKAEEEANRLEAEKAKRRAAKEQEASRLEESERKAREAREKALAEHATADTRVEDLVQALEERQARDREEREKEQREAEEQERRAAMNFEQEALKRSMLEKDKWQQQHQQYVQQQQQQKAQQQEETKRASQLPRTTSKLARSSIANAAKEASSTAMSPASSTSTTAKAPPKKKVPQGPEATAAALLAMPILECDVVRAQGRSRGSRVSVEEGRSSMAMVPKRTRSEVSRRDRTETAPKRTVTTDQTAFERKGTSGLLLPEDLRKISETTQKMQVEEPKPVQVTFPEWMAAFERIDANKDGVISLKEWLMTGGENHEFQAITGDAKKEAYIKREEWKRAFHCADRNNDVKSTAKEWGIFVFGGLALRRATPGPQLSEALEAVADVQEVVRNLFADSMKMRQVLEKTKNVQLDDEAAAKRSALEALCLSVEHRAKEILKQSLRAEKGRSLGREALAKAVSEAQIAKTSGKSPCEHERKALKKAISLCKQYGVPPAEYARATELYRQLPPHKSLDDEEKPGRRRMG